MLICDVYVSISSLILPDLWLNLHIIVYSCSGHNQESAIINWIKFLLTLFAQLKPSHTKKMDRQKHVILKKYELLLLDPIGSQYIRAISVMSCHRIPTCSEPDITRYY